MSSHLLKESCCTSNVPEAHGHDYAFLIAECEHKLLSHKFQEPDSHGLKQNISGFCLVGFCFLFFRERAQARAG